MIIIQINAIQLWNMVKTMDCEICGRHEARFIVLLESAKMSACPGCARGGKVLLTLEDPLASARKASTPSFAVSTQKSEEEIVEDYARCLRAGRAKSGLSLLQLSHKVGEQETYLHSMEQGRVSPTLNAARKLERALGIRLIVKEAVGGTGGPAGRNQPLTLADILGSQKKK